MASIRTLNAAELAARGSGVAKILRFSNPKYYLPAIKTGTGASLYGAGTLVAKTSAAVGAANPFTIGERIVYPAFVNARMLSRGGDLFAKTKRGKDLRAAVQKNKIGATGVFLRNVVFNNTDTTLKGTLLSAMIDGGFKTISHMLTHETKNGHSQVLLWAMMQMRLTLLTSSTVAMGL